MLVDELDRLATDVYATNAFVFDAWGLVWCEASFSDEPTRRVLFSQIKSVLEGCQKPLYQGGKLEQMFGSLDPPLFCHSFASVYVLGLWTSKSTNEFLMRKALRKALPKIEALTLALPPPGGGNPNSGAQHGRA